ncbi:hypothetical protein KAMAJI_01590 [Serratia phage vB_SmaM-Kamaji]|nr:hypothetical protein KAMAJI_01590 [Serratia phage vB_SmaM-Kamaji]
MSQTFSVTRALATLKSLDAKIERATNNLQVVAITAGIGNSQSVTGSAKSAVEVAEEIRVGYKALQDMIETRNKIKRAVIVSNSSTPVVIGSKTMTVAEAIETKRSIVLETNVLATLRKHYNAGNSLITKARAEFERKLEDAERNYTGGRDKKISPEDLEMIRAPIIAKGTPELLDPLDVSEKIASMTAEIDEFLLNVDFALSEINAKTDITIE